MSNTDVIVAARMSAKDRQTFKIAAMRDGMALSTWLKFLARQRVAAMQEADAARRRPPEEQPVQQMAPLPEKEDPTPLSNLPEEEFRSALRLLDILSGMPPSP